MTLQLPCRQPHALEPPKVIAPDSEATRFWLDDAGNWISGDAFWSAVTWRSFEESVGTGWIHCLDPVAFVDLHEGFLKLVTHGVALHRPVVVKIPGRLRPAILSLTRSDVRGSGINGVLSLTKLEPRPAPIRRMLEAERDPLGRMNRRLVSGVQLLSVMFVLCALAGVVRISSVDRVEAVDQKGRVVTQPEGYDGAWEQKVEAGRRLVYLYHDASSVGERLGMVLGDTEAIEGKLRDYDDVVHPVAHLLRSDIVSFNGVPHLVAQGIDTSGSRFLDVVDLSGETPKLNWEASTGFCEVPLDRYRANPPKDSVVMRLLIRPYDYYNLDYADTSRWSSYYVSDRLDSEGLFAYAEHGSHVQGMLQELFPEAVGTRVQRFRDGVRPATVSGQDIKPRRVTVRLNASGSQTDQVRIVEILGEEWVREPDELTGALASGKPLDRG